MMMNSGLERKCKAVVVAQFEGLWWHYWRNWRRSWNLECVSCVSRPRLGIRCPAGQILQHFNQFAGRQRIHVHGLKKNVIYQLLFSFESFLATPFYICHVYSAETLQIQKSLWRLENKPRNASGWPILNVSVQINLYTVHIVFCALSNRYVILESTKMCGGTLWHSQKVAGSIPDGVTGIFHCLIPHSRTVALRSTQPLTEMSCFPGVKAAGA